MVAAVSDLSTYLANAKQDRSIDDIAEAARRGGHEVSRSVVAKYLRGEHGRRPPESTLAGLAAGFGVDVRVLRRLAGRAPGELGPYVPTEEASSLTQQQRDAINQLIKAFVNEGGSGDAGNAEAQKTPNPAPAPGDAPDMLDVRDEAIRLAIQDNLTLAARRTRESGKMKTTDDAQKLAGEDDQDDGGEDPA